MKNIVIVLCLFSFHLAAQPTQEVQKIGHADWQYIFSKLPEFKQIENDLKIYEGQLQTQLKMKSQELEAKYKAYQQIPAATPDAIKKDKESELAYLQENLQRFQQDAQSSMQKKQDELVAPVFAKVGSAIEETARENGFSYIINPQMMGGGDVLMFVDERYNISNLVLRKLGVDVPVSVPSK